MVWSVKSDKTRFQEKFTFSLQNRPGAILTLVPRCHGPRGSKVHLCTLGVYLAEKYDLGDHPGPCPEGVI